MDLSVLEIDSDKLKGTVSDSTGTGTGAEIIFIAAVADNSAAIIICKFSAEEEEEEIEEENDDGTVFVFDANDL